MDENINITTSGRIIILMNKTKYIKNTINRIYMADCKTFEFRKLSDYVNEYDEYIFLFDGCHDFSFSNDFDALNIEMAAIKENLYNYGEDMQDFYNKYKNKYLMFMFFYGSSCHGEYMVLDKCVNKEFVEENCDKFPIIYVDTEDLERQKYIGNFKTFMTIKINESINIYLSCLKKLGVDITGFLKQFSIKEKDLIVAYDYKNIIKEYASFFKDIDVHINIFSEALEKLNNFSDEVYEIS